MGFVIINGQRVHTSQIREMTDDEKDRYIKDLNLKISQLEAENKALEQKLRDKEG